MRTGSRQLGLAESKNTPLPLMPCTGEIHPVPTLWFEAWILDRRPTFTCREQSERKAKPRAPGCCPRESSPWPRAALPPEEARHGRPSAAQRPRTRGSKMSRRPSPVPPACARAEPGLCSSIERGNLAAPWGLSSVRSCHLKFWGSARSHRAFLLRWKGTNLTAGQIPALGNYILLTNFSWQFQWNIISKRK